jgi:hypothetical protein
MEPGGSLSCLQHSAIVPVLFQTNPIYALPFCFLNIHFNIILPYTPRSSNRSRSLRFPHQNPVCTSLHLSFSSHTFHMPRSPYSSSLEHWNNFRWGVVRAVKLFISLFLAVLFNLLPFMFKCIHHHSILWSRTSGGNVWTRERRNDGILHNFCPRSTFNEIDSMRLR